MPLDHLYILISASEMWAPQGIDCLLEAVDEASEYTLLITNIRITISDMISINNYPMEVEFCDPHSLWQRGTNEKTNMLIRDFFPKQTDFSMFTMKGSSMFKNF